MSLSEGNARLMRSQQPKVVGPVDGSFDDFVSPPDPGFVDPNGFAAAPYFPTILPFVTPTLTFPASITPTVWLDGNQQAYADAAGLVPNSFGFVRRINGGGATGLWFTNTDVERPYRDGNSVRFEPIVTPGSAFRSAPGGGIIGNAATIAFSFVSRASVTGGPSMGLFHESAEIIGCRMGGDQIAVFSSAGAWVPAARLRIGALNTIIIRYTPVGIDLMLDAGGTITLESTVLALPGTGALGLWFAGQYGADYLYGSMTQGLGVPRAITDAERDALHTWMVGQNAPAAYPDYASLLVFIGDSITSGAPGVPYYQTYAMLMLPSLRMGHQVENANCAVGGSGVYALQSSAMWTVGLGLYSSTRIGNIMIFAIGCNDLANNNSTDLVLYGTGGPAGSGIYPACDIARARGFKVVIVTIGPRSDAMAVTQAVYNSRRAIVNANLLTEGLLHADAVVDTTQIANYGRDGDSNNAITYQGDHIHPTPVGQALLAPYVSAKILPLLPAGH